MASMATDMNSNTAAADLGARAPYPKRPFSGREMFFSIGSLLAIAIIIQMIYAAVI